MAVGFLGVGWGRWGRVLVGLVGMEWAKGLGRGCGERVLKRARGTGACRGWGGEEGMDVFLGGVTSNDAVVWMLQLFWLVLWN